MKLISFLFVEKLHLVILIQMLANLYFVYEDVQKKLFEKDEQKKIILSKISNSKKQIKKAQDFQKDIEVSKQRVQEVTSQIEEVQRQLPNSISDTEILDYFSQTAEGLNIKDVNQSPMNEILKNFYYSKIYSFVAEGTYLQFLVFFENIGNQKRLYNVKNLVIEKSKKDYKGRFQILTMNAQLEAFRYNPAYNAREDVKNDKEK